MKKTLLEATQHWVYSFNAIPTAMIARLMKHNPEEWTEVTLTTIGDTVYVYDEDSNGTITAQVEDGYNIGLENGTEITATVDDFTLVQNDILPCWGTMWSFGDSLDENWLENGTGYDFYAEHWIPLYIARGLHWHNQE